MSLEAFTPFIPLNVDDSSLPVAVFQYKLTNRSRKVVDVSLAFSLLNPVGYDGKAFLDSNEHPGFGKNLNKIRDEQAGDVKVAGLDLTTEKYTAGDPLYGSMALLTTTPSYTARASWETGAWWDSYQKWVDEFSETGKVHDSKPPQISPDGRSEHATLAPSSRLSPGESTTITFILAWYFPVRENYWHAEDEKLKGKKLTNYYGTRFKSAWDVACHTASRLPELERKTRSFTDTFFAAGLPQYVLEAVSSQASIMRTNTCMLLEGKQFFGFEGCGDDQHNGWMNCSQVWNYEQAVAFLFPELERSMRDTDFLHEMRSDDSMAFRSMVPLDIEHSDFRPAADGQMGCIMKLYREWQISGDDAFLRKMWPNAKRALEFAWKFWDADKDGVMEGEQHNTLSDQMLGQWFADVLGLDIGLQNERIRKTLLAIYRNNFKHDFWQHANTQRIYAVNDDKGLLLCSWPNGGRPALPFVYSDEVWTGIEYQVAAHSIYRGLLEEGLAIVKAISDRYDGVRRNPWDQIEWGHHYTRAMASYSVFLALTGFRYSAVEGSLTFSPRLAAEKFRCFFAAGSAWGQYKQDRRSGLLTSTLECRHGKLALRQLTLGSDRGYASIPTVTLTGSRNTPVSCTVKGQGTNIQVNLANELVVREGESVRRVVKA